MIYSPKAEGSRLPSIQGVVSALTIARGNIFPLEDLLAYYQRSNVLPGQEFPLGRHRFANHLLPDAGEFDNIMGITETEQLADLLFIAYGALKTGEIEQQLGVAAVIKSILQSFPPIKNDEIFFHLVEHELPYRTRISINLSELILILRRRALILDSEGEKFCQLMGDLFISDGLLDVRVSAGNKFRLKEGTRGIDIAKNLGGKVRVVADSLSRIAKTAKVNMKEEIQPLYDIANELTKHSNLAGSVQSEAGASTQDIYNFNLSMLAVVTGTVLRFLRELNESFNSFDTSEDGFFFKQGGEDLRDLVVQVTEVLKGLSSCSNTDSFHQSMQSLQSALIMTPDEFYNNNKVAAYVKEIAETLHETLEEIKNWEANLLEYAELA